MLNNIINNFNAQLTPSPSKDWLKSIGNIAQLPQATTKKSTNFFSKFMGKAGDELKWLGQDVGDLAKTAKLTSTGGIAGVGEMAYGITDSLIKQPDMMGVEDKVVSGAAKGAWKVAGLAPNPYTIGAAAVLSGFDILNKSAGDRLNSDGTQDMVNTGYANFSADDLLTEGGKGKKGTLWSKWFHKGRTRDQNARIDFGKRANHLASNISYLNEQNTLAFQNTTGVLHDKYYQQKMGGYGTNILAAKKGTKIKRLQDGGDLNGLITLIKSTRGSGRRLFEPKPQVNTFGGGEGGRFSGGGAGISYLTPNYIVKDSTYVQPFILHQNDFRNAFEDARKKGLSEFVFNNKRYNTNVDTTNTINHDAIARQRTENVGLPLDTVYLHNVKTRTSDDFIESKSDTINLPLPLATEYESSINKKKAVKPHNFEHIIRKAKSNVKLHKSGGKLEDPNIIPEGAFHSRKNNLPDEIAENVTPKGIPVIVKDGDKITQIAEIERSEIVFNKKVSEQIEDYLKDYNEAETQKEKDKIAIECGKLISDQIINNTIDNVGLLNKE